MSDYDDSSAYADGLDGFIGELAGALGLGARARHWLRNRARRRQVGMQRLLRRRDAIAVPDLGSARLPWAHPELVGIRPSGWSPAEYEQAIRAALGNPNYTLHARASFAGTANEPQTASFQPQSTNFLGFKVAFDKSSAAASIIALVRQSERHQLSSDTRVRLEVVFGSAAAGFLPRWNFIAPQQPMTVDLICETNVGAAHTVDFAYHGWLLGGNIEQQ